MENSHQMNVGVIGTGAIARKHAQAYRNIGYRLVACTNCTPERGLKFAAETGAEFVLTDEELCDGPILTSLTCARFPHTGCRRWSWAPGMGSTCWCRNRWRWIWKQQRA